MARYRTSITLAVLMVMASIGSILARPVAKLANERPAVSLEKVVPTWFGDWREAPQVQVHVVNPQMQEMLDRVYSDILTRVYVNAAGYRVMLSLAYGSDQRGGLQAHKPEVCYPAQGFTVRANEAGRLQTAYGEIPVRRLFTTMGARQEPVTYWFTIGDTAVKSATQKRVVEVLFGLTGRIPDGMLFRVSSIDADAARAYRIHDQFVDQLLAAVAPSERKRLSGLGTP